MAYPDDLPTFSNPLASDPRVGHATLHGDVNDAIEALAAKVGVNDGSGFDTPVGGTMFVASGTGSSRWWGIDEALTSNLGGTLRKATVTLSSADILDLHNTEVVLVAAPGAGKHLVPHRLVTWYAYGTTAYATDGSNAPIYKLDGVGTYGDLLENLTDPSAHVYSSVPNQDYTSSPENKAIVASTDGTQFTLGDGPLHVTIWYSTEDVP